MSFPQAVKCSPIQSWPGSFLLLHIFRRPRRGHLYTYWGVRWELQPDTVLQEEHGEFRAWFLPSTPWPCWRKQVSLQKIKYPLCERQENRMEQAFYKVNMGSQCLAVPLLCRAVVGGWSPCFLTLAHFLRQSCSHPTSHEALELP